VIFEPFLRDFEVGFLGGVLKRVWGGSFWSDFREQRVNFRSEVPLGRFEYLGGFEYLRGLRLQGCELRCTLWV
jgi:hypothetical protein